MRASLVFGFRRYKQRSVRHKSRTLGGRRGQFPVVINRKQSGGFRPSAALNRKSDIPHPDPGADRQKPTRAPTRQI